MNKKSLTKILETSSISGYEDESIKVFISQSKEFGADTYVDIFNNAFAQFGEKSAPVTVMIEAHIDEIGFQVCYIDNDGLIYVRKVGFVDDYCIPGSVVEIMTNDGNKIKGIIGKKPVHLSAYDEIKSFPNINNLWVDTGLEPDRVKQIISVGAPVCYSPNLSFLGNYRISSKGIDNKIGLYILTEAIRRISRKHENIRIVIVASAQEEVGLRGAQYCTNQLKPDYAISIDTDFATDVPDCPKTIYGDVNLGNGVVISKNLDSNRLFSKMAEDIAIKNKIPHQVSTHYLATGDTNASVIQLYGSNTKTLMLGIPCRYMHTPVEMVDIRDVESAIDLIEQILEFISQQ